MTDQPNNPIKGRGAQSQVANRFESIRIEVDPSDEIPDRPRTEFFADQSQTIVSENSSPDIPFRYSLNPYRGCEHGCSYCYARPTHEFLGMSAGLDFETKIIVKERAVELLRDVLAKPSWQPEAMMLSGVTDPYQPVERAQKITRGLLQLLADCKHPISIITKNALIERDVDILAVMAQDNLVHAAISITTLDAELAQVMEPRTSSPAARLRAITTLSDAGIPVRVMTAPVIPGLNDHELPQVLAAAAAAGATSAGYVMLRLPGAVEPVFCDWLTRVRPAVADKVIAKVREVRGGEMNSSQFGTRMRGQGVRADSIVTLFETFARKHALTQKTEPLRCDLFVPPRDRRGQLSLF
jgi:DNA repair photolyase